MHFGIQNWRVLSSLSAASNTFVCIYLINQSAVGFRSLMALQFEPDLALLAFVFDSLWTLLT